MTYEDAASKVRALAHFLLQSGIQKGDRVALSGKNSSEWAVVYLAVLTCGALICPIDWALHLEELENLLVTAQPKFFFVDEEKFLSFAQRTEFKTFCLSPKYPDSFVGNLADESADLSGLDLFATSEEDVAAILFTSGTMGKPKGVMLTHKNLVSDTFIARTKMYFDETDVFYALLPIHHAYTMLAVFLESISAGCELVFAKSMAVSRMLRELKEGRVTLLLGVPMLFNKLLDGIMKGIKDKGPLVSAALHLLMAFSYVVKKVFKVNIGKLLFRRVLDKASIASLRIAICGGGPLAANVCKRYNEMGIDFVQGYGLTETSPIIALNPKDHFKIESVGQYFFPYMEMKILNPSADGIGEVAVKGPMVFKGYYQMPQQTAQAFTTDGFFKTGDLGRLDSEGYLILAGRDKNMVVTEGGKNVYPEEIESAFQLYPQITQITVRGYVANEATKSEQIEALIYPSDELLAKLGVSREGASQDECVSSEVWHVVKGVNKTLQPYARISRITVLDAPLEMTTTQKVKRSDLKRSDLSKL